LIFLHWTTRGAGGIGVSSPLSACLSSLLNGAHEYPQTAESVAPFRVGAACGLKMRAAGLRKGAIHTGALSSDGVDGREGGKAAQDAYGLFGCNPADGANRLLRVVCGVRCNDHVVKPKERVGRTPVSLLAGSSFRSSNAAPAIHPSLSARWIAAFSTIGPRAVLMR
jgi:hypothetical protein